ncbi:hypothetical protein [Engelhardtia mirabilis]|uniref:Uncharacterized protein n=1 Tax=Engelhardtia mirabilis TaxID=2528011 RepID=A0A518BE17_9BACT|nr:hypothetical protein Pla133_02840 [Planctomycetes bacterium Pla133]QDU99546.1 hypothetical protein Pla86_02840 [Planctomycetes bacterium Pla86]
MRYTTRIASLSSLPLLLAVVAGTAAPALAGEVFVKPPAGTSDINNSAWVPEDGSDSDTYSWDEFTLAETQTITEVRWRGGYSLNAQYGKVTGFRVSFFDSVPGGFQPVITALPEKEELETVIATFHVSGNAGETFVGSVGGKLNYDYHYTLPTPVTLQGGVKYWFRVVGEQPIYPDWGPVTGLGGNGSHFRYSTGTTLFQNWPHDLSFSMHAQWVNIGQGLAGTVGTPGLGGSGSLAAGVTTTLAISSARPLAPAWIIAGTSQLNLPIAGGTLVPNPLWSVPVQCDAGGSASLGFALTPGVPTGTELVAQAWILDPQGPLGLAATNAVTATTP